MTFYFHLVCFNFSIFYSVLPFHLVYVFQFLFFVVVLSEVFIKNRRKACVCVCVCVCVYANSMYNTCIYFIKLMTFFLAKNCMTL